MSATSLGTALSLEPRTTDTPLNSWHGEFPLGGSALQIAAVKNQDGRLEIFYIGTGNHLYHNWQTAANGLVWNGETAFPGDSANQVTAAVNIDGIVEIFYVGTNNDLYHNRQTQPGSAIWTGETRFANASAKYVAVGMNGDGRLEIFYVGTNNDLYHNWQLQPGGTVWAGETHFANDSAQQIAVGLNSNNELEIFYVGTNSDLYHNRQSSPGGPNWLGETRFTNDSAKQIAVARNANGELEIFYVGTNNDLYHNRQTAASSTTWGGEIWFLNDSAQSVAVNQNSDGRLEIFYVGTNNDLYHNWQTAASGTVWAGETQFSGDSAKQIAVVQNQDGRLEIFYVGTNNLIYHNWQTSGRTGFGSNSNYLLASNCNSLTNLSVAMLVTEDIVPSVSSGATKGLSFQLNAYSPQNQKTGYQQYVIALWGNTVEGSIDNWNASGSSETVHNFFSLATLPDARIPAGYVLTISLKNDAAGNVTAATYVIVDNTGKTVANASKTVSSDTTNLAPITAFELNIVGPVNSESSVLSSGAGTITYRSSVAMTPMTSVPSCTEAQVVTAETANTTYSPLAAAASTLITQSFSVTDNEQFFLRKPGAKRPSAVIPQR